MARCVSMIVGLFNRRFGPNHLSKEENELLDMVYEDVPH